jgi:PTH1 family peptidyl-tRNA hydrolase
MAIDLVLGLGNPGERYIATRHNVGFAVTDGVLRRRGRGGWTRRPSHELAVITPGRMVVLARPLSFMNRSGGVAVSLLSELCLEPENMLVIVDDVDLPIGQLRLRLSGGPGTHNGMRDICQAVGPGFPRLRVGVRGAGIGGDLADYVLDPFDADEIELAEATIERAADAVDGVLRNGVERAMNVFNRR